jgi:oligopeptide/dipeptide ABC transporter ATP-binding protein
MKKEDLILQVKDLKKYFPVQSLRLNQGKLVVHAVDGISFSLSRGEVLGVVGESGCGKSTLARVILRLIEPLSGEIFFEGKNIVGINKKSLVSLRKEMQLIFQDPYSSLNPKLSVGYLVGEGLVVNRICDHKEVEDRVIEILKKVGMKPEQINRYPYEFSGGQRQRISIARALVLKPRLLIGDEPVSALDVSIKAQIINLLGDLKEEYDFSCIMISHDLNVVKHVSDRVAVMYLGRFVEMASKKELYRNPKHPYTQALISAIPTPKHRGAKDRIILRGDPPSPIDPPSGCSFHPRCFRKREECSEICPPFVDVGEGHLVACYFANCGFL